ncbi:prolyl-tRNA synthetase [Ligilactobacillus salitolerans]|uniref:Prolyl-tRNA synthetase n=1 Tax=Ligilactobacillus salitolerans TaxID=1808352 RepID=A0A401IQR7_9LACO|nr:YbaK/EbsC family protein [Ligilactobacillus salitolerans]GBG93878.1 prolyl-tRNA synthetase [Ligilactobacillus salitolerans]
MPKATRAQTLEFLQENQLPFTEVQHQAVWTAHDPTGLEDPTAPVIKNLFLKRKKTNNFYLCLVVGQKKLNFKALAQQLHTSRSQLTFASPSELEEVLGLQPGAVTPLGLLNDTQKQVTVLLDSDLSKLTQIGIHPNVNTSTVFISYVNLLKLVEKTGHQFQTMELE